VTERGESFLTFGTSLRNLVQVSSSNRTLALIFSLDLPLFHFYFQCEKRRIISPRRILPSFWLYHRLRQQQAFAPWSFVELLVPRRKRKKKKERKEIR
jgi:hypothetical protein